MQIDIRSLYYNDINEMRCEWGGYYRESERMNRKEKPSHDLKFNEEHSHKLELVVLDRRAEGN